MDETLFTAIRHPLGMHATHGNLKYIKNNARSFLPVAPLGVTHISNAPTLSVKLTYVGGRVKTSDAKNC